MSDAKAAYARLRAGHLRAVQAALEDHIARLEWPRERTDRYRDQRLRLLLAYACERSPFHAARMHGLDPSSATLTDLVKLPVMTKRDAQEQWNAIVTVPGLDREKAEQTLAEQPWFSYTPQGQQIFSSGGSSGVRGVYVWDWEMLWPLHALPADAGSRGAAQPAPAPGTAWALEAACRRMPAGRCSMCLAPAGWRQP